MDSNLSAKYNKAIIYCRRYSPQVTKNQLIYQKTMSTQKSLKRITDPDYLLCHRCGRRLRGSAHRECALAALKEQMGKVESKIKHAISTRSFEGAGTIGHSPCRLDDGSVIIPAEEARKIREEGFTSELTGTKYGPWTNGRLREKSRIQRKGDSNEEEDEEEESLEEIEGEEVIEDWEWELLHANEDLFFLAYDQTDTSSIPKLTKFVVEFIRRHDTKKRL